MCWSGKDIYAVCGVNPIHYSDLDKNIFQNLNIKIPPLKTVVITTVETSIQIISIY